VCGKELNVVGSEFPRTTSGKLLGKLEVSYIDRQNEEESAARMRAKSRGLGAVDDRKRGRSLDEY